MNSITRSITNIFGGAVRALETFPAAILCALAFTVVTMIRIQLDWSQQEPYNFLFNCLHWSLALGAVLSMTSITAAQSRYNSKGTFLTANLIGAAAVVITFLLLYFLGEAHADISARYAVISTLASARVIAAILVSFLLFILIAGYPKTQSDFSRSFFMSHKALFIALLYGIVIMAGASGVAGAVQALLYHDMSEKVYMYIGTITGFLAFTIFLGYFPDFHKGIIDDHREVAQRQPRFIEILFVYIIIPINLALTVVLLLWSGRTILTGTWPEFTRLAGIATAYTFVGLWLHIMVTHHESSLARFYRRIYPFTALIILAFEAAALFAQLDKFGLKVTEYWFILVWVIAVISAVLLLVFRAKAHQPIVLLICAVAVFSVLPLAGYHAMPVAAQTDRLEKLLAGEGMLESGRLIPAAAEPELSVRESITDAVYYLAEAEDAKLPSWFDEHLNNFDEFKTKLGFEPVWPKPDDGSVDYLGTSLHLRSEAIDVSEYKWGVLLQENAAKITGDRGVYTVTWIVNSKDGIPTLQVKLNESVILEQDLNSYIDRIAAKFPPGRQTGPTEASLEDMSIILENEGISVLLIFNNVQINVDPLADHINYWLDLNMIYFNEK